MIELPGEDSSTQDEVAVSSVQERTEWLEPSVHKQGVIKGMDG